MDINYVLTGVNILVGLFIAWRTLRRNETKEKIEYFEKKAADLEKRIDKMDATMKELENQLARYRMMKDYVFEILGPTDTVTINAQMILEGRLEHKRRKTDAADLLNERE